MSYEELEAERNYFKSLVDAFFSGEVVGAGSLKHFIMAKYGKIRLDAINSERQIVG